MAIGDVMRTTRQSRGQRTSTDGSSRNRSSAATTGARRVRVPELGLGLLIIAVTVLAALMWSRSLTSTTSVVVAAESIRRGEVLDEGNVIAVEVRGGTELGLLPAARLDDVMGQVALVDLPAGDPIVAATVGSLPRPTADEVLVAVALERGAAPTDLAAGDVVGVVLVPDASMLDGQQPTMLRDTAVVRLIDAADDYDTRAVVTLGVSVHVATEVAAASDVRLVRVDR